jgi:hypothetical protein
LCCVVVLFFFLLCALFCQLLWIVHTLIQYIIIVDSSTTTERHSDTLSDKDPYMFERSKSNRKSKRKNSFGNDSKTYGLLQNTPLVLSIVR